MWIIWYGPTAVVSDSSSRASQVDGAAESGRLDTLEWLWGRLGGHRDDIVWENAMDAATGAGQLAAVEWLIDRHCTAFDYVFYWAARNGHVDVLDLLWKRVGLDQKATAKMANDSAKSGSVPMLQWVVDHEMPLNSSACHSAASRGHLDALRFLRSHHCPWDGRTLRDAALNGHLDILQWALANGCPWTAEDRQYCLRVCPGHRPGLRRWIKECWPEPPKEDE